MSNEGKPEPVQQRALQTREALLQGAARVFTRRSYPEARLKDIAHEAGTSEGSLHFHFGNKRDVAEAVLRAQQDRMNAVLVDVVERADDGLTKLLALIDGLAELISSDIVTQAGIKLSTQVAQDLPRDTRDPYFEWIGIAKSLIADGVDEGSIEIAVEVELVAEYSNVLFLGAQVLSDFEDAWSSLPRRVKALETFIVGALAPSRAEDR